MDVNDIIEFIKQSKELVINKDFVYSFIFNKGNSNEYISQQGYIYCYAIELSDSDAKDVFDTVKNGKRNNNKLKSFDDWKPFKKTDKTSLYNLYVGETENLTARTRSHVKGFRGCGGIRLNELPELITKKNVHFAAIQVRNNLEERKTIEKELNSISQSLLKTTSISSDIVKELLE